MENAVIDAGTFPNRAAEFLTHVKWASAAQLKRVIEGISKSFLQCEYSGTKLQQDTDRTKATVALRIVVQAISKRNRELRIN